MSGSEESSVKRRIVWTIGRCTKEEFNKYKGKYKSSEVFEITIGINKTTWYLAIKLEEENGIGYCGFYLYKYQADSNDFITKFTASIQKSNGDLEKTFAIDKKSSEFKVKDEGWGRPKFIKSDDIFDVNDGFVVDGCLNFIIDLELVKEKKTKLNGCECEDKIIYLNAENFNSEKFSDFTFISSDGVKIPVHRCIVACRSKVLEKMFSTENWTKQVKLDNIDGKTMTEMLRYIYKGEVENIDSIASSLLYAAEKYDLAHLKSMCLESLMKIIFKGNVFEILVLADRRNEELLLEKCIKFIKGNFEDLQKSDKWKNLGLEL